MNTDRDLVSAEMLLPQDESDEATQTRRIAMHNKVLGEVSAMLDPGHDSNLHKHFSELYTFYL